MAGDDPFFDDRTHWVWCDAARRPYHNVVDFRRTFDVVGDVDGDPGAATLHVTADTRYDVFLNGEWLGFGPARAWPAAWPVDAYDFAGLLRRGRNVVAVRVQHFGLSTFQSLHADAGLVARLAFVDAGGRRVIDTDGAWRCCPCEAYRWPVPRVSCMLGWEEQFDARLENDAWTRPEFDDADWPAASAVRRAGEGAHPAFVPRDIPMLTRTPASPVRVLASEIVRPAAHVWSINPRDLIDPADKSANHVRGRVLLATDVWSDAAQAVAFHQPHPHCWVDWKLNGELLRFDDMTLQPTDTGVAHAALRPGRNTLLGRMKPVAHYWWAVTSVWADGPITLRSPATASPTPWLALGPFGDDADRGPIPGGLCDHPIQAPAYLPTATPAAHDGIWARGTLTPADIAAPFARPVTADMIAGDDVFARCASERVVTGARPTIDAPDALRHDTAEWTRVHPSSAGDVRLLLDFGREVVGFHELEIDAPAGTVVDVHNFEFVQPDGRFNLCEGMNNTFRYVCREGPQRYRTLLRRGFRYSWVSLRRFDRPVRLRCVRVLVSTYPQRRQGSFACSDPLLNDIWEAGAHSVACCSEDAYTDCPTYEQAFWVGDGRNEARVDLLANGDARLSARCLRLAARSLERSPLVESQVPSGWQNVLPAWSFLWMRWAAEHFDATGDVTLAREMVAAVDRQVTGMKAFVARRGLIRIAAWNMFDWAAMDTTSGGEVAHLNCLAVLGLRQAAGMAAAVDANGPAAAWAQLADGLAAAVNTHLWDDARGAFADCVRPDGTRSPVFSQQTQTAAYIAGVATGARADRCRAVMHAAPPGFVTAGSPFFMSFLLEGLVREGRADVLPDTIRDYWGLQIRAGATTFWETYRPDRPRLTRSHCHGWSAAPTALLSRHVLGITPAAPGYKRVRVAPTPGNLTHASGTVPTPHGPVHCAWRTADAAGFDLRLTLPDGVDAEVVWPTAGEPTVVEGEAVGPVAGRFVVRGAAVRIRSAAPPGDG